VTAIVSLAQEGEYLRAHERYLRLAIGDSAWPMGVTMVGIHERAGRERISVDQITHIMNDDVVRKYVTAVMRVLSYVQDKFPTTPSKMFQ
jgi:hypothetical protein